MMESKLKAKNCNRGQLSRQHGVASYEITRSMESVQCVPRMRNKKQTNKKGEPETPACVTCFENKRKLNLCGSGV